MKRRLLIVSLLSLVLVLAMGASVSAQSATNDAPWTSSITYYTPSTTGGQMVVSYYAEGSATAVDAQTIDLSAKQAGSLFIGNTDVPAGFEGAAVISSDVPVVAVNVQFASSGLSGQYGRLLYSGFSIDQAAETFFIPTVLYQRFGSTSMIGVQNVESFDIDVTMKLYAAGETTPTATVDQNIKAQSSWVVSAAELGLPANFNGSATIEPQSGGVAGRVVASVQETDDSGRGAYAFEGVAQGSETVYMASMLCDAFGGQNSFYAVQNASLVDDATVTIDFYEPGNATPIASKAATTIPAGGKISVNPCNEGVPAGTSGSAVISGEVGDAIIAIGKVKAPNGLATSFVGESAGAMDSSSAYIRWADNHYNEFRAFVAVMNVSATAADCTATYYDATGNIAGSEDLLDIAQYNKVNTNASSAGALDTNGEFGTGASVAGTGGALELSCDQPVVTVVRLTRRVDLDGGSTTLFGEDYNATAGN
ncbi:MAG: hypothetical protein H6662_05605 [Ardenticatenaceae bacterium]|nr:hypothetical protein [Anaerolineales bacterium]MCB8921040.1 hypothetical protein [Ardenticatenaceae bacterium]MCB8991196.1 hypothetical protein [Ardenticatenaceae bacterium]